MCMENKPEDEIKMNMDKFKLVGLLLVATVCYAPLKAHAAQIIVNNCQSTKVRICSFENKNNTVPGSIDSHNLEENEHGKFKCKANCAFKIMNCSTYPGCDSCKKNTNWLDHSWGRGTYNLVGLEQNDKDNYKSSNFKKTDSTDVCE